MAAIFNIKYDLLLRLYGVGYNYLIRTNRGFLWACTEKPIKEKNSICWIIGKKACPIRDYHLFKEICVLNTEPFNIEEALNARGLL
jgi:hypothetical protein